jgi:hypothetical protein
MRTAELQDELWSRAVAFGQETPAIPTAAPFAQALIQMFEVNSRRVAALAFAAVFHLIADLDRPDAGFLTVSQQSLPDLQTRWHRQ